MLEDKPPPEWADMDGRVPLTEREIVKIRLLLLERDREQWARRRIKVFVPWAVAVVGAGWAAVEWFFKYFTIRH